MKKHLPKIFLYATLLVAIVVVYVLFLTGVLP